MVVVVVVLYFLPKLGYLEESIKWSALLTNCIYRLPLHISEYQTPAQIVSSVADWISGSCRFCLFCLFVVLFVCCFVLFFLFFVCLFCLFIYLFVYLFICLFVCLFVYLFFTMSERNKKKLRKKKGGVTSIILINPII